MIPTPEVKIQRRLTIDFIEADPLELQLMRPVRTEDGAGGYETGDPVPVGGLQRLRLIPLGDGAQERLMADGRQVSPSYMLMGPYNANMQRWDTFELRGDRYQIIFINQNTQYEVKGEVAYLGG
jgi:hypothetical protein